MFWVALTEAMQQNKSVRPAQVCGTTTFKGAGKFYICFRTTARSQMLRRVVAYCTSCASRGSLPASWPVGWLQGLAGGEYYSAASSGSKVRQVC
jgi:hypothetical protein